MARGRRRYATIGSADTMSVPEARREARKLLAIFIEPARKDSGPRTPGHPMDAFAEEFLERYVRDWFASMAKRPGSANRAMPALSVMMKKVELWGYRRHNSKPRKNTRRYRTQAKERFLTAEGNGLAQRRARPRPVLVPAYRRHRPLAC